ncbi:Myosin-17 [Sesamum alatum]|uniref:Myosin-17 n=1 Tax=Sesamum alatum TaxID=300844 RepID=A0AAE1YMQ3_9LAMI|nr:Myosin-17 [Sesamum alatum]
MNISIGQHSNSKAIIGVLDTYWFESIGQSRQALIWISVAMYNEFGKTKVLLRAGQMAELDARRAQVLGNAARTIQRQCRTYIARKNFNLLRQAAIQLQSCWRAISACKLYEQLLLEDAAIKIQKNFRCHTAQISYLTLQDSAVIVQTSMRAMAARVTKEREARKAAEEAPPVIKQTPVVVQDTSKVESLKALLLSEKQVAEEAKKTCADTVTKNMDLAKNLEEAEAKVDQLQDFTQRLEKELSNLKSENRQLRQIALTMPPTGEAISAEPTMTIIPENQNVLINCISQELGFSDGKPVAASIIYESLLQWKSFEVERTSVFDRIIQTVASAIEVPDNDDVLAYWLCNTSTLLMLLQRTLKASGAASLTFQRRRPSSASPFGRMSQGLRASPQSAGLSFINGRMLGRVDDLRQVEAKYPALLFKQQLTALLEKIYGLIRDNLKKEIAPLLGLCIQAPRRSRSSLVKGRSRANAVAQQALIAHWQSIVKSLNNYLKIMKANYVPPFLVRKVFTQIFLFINVQLFNSLLLRRECCSLSNGEYVKAGLPELEQWCCSATEEYVGSAWDELKHIRQAVGFLVLSIQQLYRISTMYWDDKYGTHSVSSDVISSMRVMMTEDSNNSVSSSFLLDDDSSIPFSVDDISKSMQHIQVAVVKPDPLIRENSRLEENLSDVKSKNQVLCQQAPTMPPTGKAIPAQPMSTMIPRTPENGNILNGETKSAHATALVVANLEEPESEDKPQKSLNEEQQDLLIKCISQDLGFSGGKPVAACIVYRSLLHWRSFEVERASVFDCIVQTVVSAIKVSDKYDVLAYWLCNTSTLLMLLQYTLKASGDASLTPQRQSSAASLFGRMSQGSSASPESSRLSIINGQMLGRLDNLRQVEAKKPAFLFKQQLTALLEKIYGRTRDNLKKEISPLLDLSIQAPRTSRASSVKGRPRANAVAQQALIAHWQSIVRSLNNYLKIMKENYVPPFLVQKIFTQMFSFINVQLFNSLLLRRECCSFSNGEYVKAGLAELEQWCCYATEEYVGSAWDELKHVRQAVEFLIIHQKPKKTLNQIRKELCPVLSIQQLYKISTMYWDDKYDTDGFSSDVISSMRFLVAIDSNSSASSNLDDDLSIPISADDLSQSMRPIEVADVEPPPLLSENAGFAFLHQRND